MGRKNDDAPRVVGFDFGPPAAPGSPAPPVPDGYTAPPPPAYPPPPPPPPAPQYAEPAYAAPAGYAAPRYAAAPYASPEYATPPDAPGYDYSGGYAAPAQQEPYGYPAPAQHEPYGYAAPAQHEPYGYAATAAPADTYWGGPAAPPQPWNATPGYDLGGPAKPAREFPLGSIVKVVVVLLFLSGGVKVALRTFKDPVTLPPVLAGAQRDRSPQAEQLAKSAAANIENVHGKNAAVYSNAGIPAYLLLAGDSDDDSGSDIYNTYAREIRADGDQTTPPLNFGDVTCTTTTTGGASISICFWGGSKSDGLVIAFADTPLDDLALVTKEARTAVNR